MAGRGDEFLAETGLVDRFEQAGTETAVYSHRQANDGVGQGTAVGEVAGHGLVRALRWVDGGLSRRWFGGGGGKQE